MDLSVYSANGILVRVFNGISHLYFRHSNRYLFLPAIY
jgi:hypothetical protein